MLYLVKNDMFTIFLNFIDTCQLRLDFETFDIMGPTGSDEAAGGACVEDRFVVTQRPTSNANIPVICGLNSGQHSK